MMAGKKLSFEEFKLLYEINTFPEAVK